MISISACSTITPSGSGHPESEIDKELLPARDSLPAKDPFELLNRTVYYFNDQLDSFIFKPVAKGYQWITPQPVDEAVTHIFSNIDDITVTINNLLQFKFRDAASDSGRFLINSTIGIFGIFDVATNLGLEKHDEDFGQTLGYWGVPSGPYLVLPLFGPSTLRDTGGTVVDFNTDDLILSPLSSEIKLGLTGLKYLDKRADLLHTTNLLEQSGSDPYTFTREAYLQYREFKVADGVLGIESFESNIDFEAEFESEK